MNRHSLCPAKEDVPDQTYDSFFRAVSCNDVEMKVGQKSLWYKELEHLE